MRDVASQLRLDERTVTALETDDFTHLPAPTFVRGYLRGYARLLGVPVGPVMEAYDREGFAPPGLVADISEAPQANASDFPVRITTVAVMAVLAVLVVMWWNNQAFDDLDIDRSGVESTRQDTEPAGSPTTSQTTDDRTAEEAPAPDGQPAPRGDNAVATPDSAAMGSTANPEPEKPTEQAPVAAAEPASPPAVDQVIERAQSVLAQTRGELDAMRSAMQEDGTRSTEQAESDSPQAVDPGTPSSDARTAAPAPEASPPPPSSADGAAASGDARLVLEFPIESWVEVYARDDTRLFYGLVKPGRTLDLAGRPPMRVLLGRTAGVRATYNGEVIDLAPHTEKGVARFTLDR